MKHEKKGDVPNRVKVSIETNDGGTSSTGAKGPVAQNEGTSSTGVRGPVAQNKGTNSTGSRIQ